MVLACSTSMRSAKRTTWAVLIGVVGMGLLAVLVAVGFALLGKPRHVNPGAELSELMNKVDPNAIRVGAVGTGPSSVRPMVAPAQPPHAAPEPAASSESEARPRLPSVEDENPTVIVLAALPEPTNGPTTTAPTATAAGETAPPPTSTATAATTPIPTPTTDLDTSDVDPDTGETGETGETDSEVLPAEPPPGAERGVTYCGAMTCVVGYKCCCDGCVPFEQACDPRSCEAQAGLSISVPCGMDLCDPGEVCCDARCGVCARAGECSAQLCN